MDRTIPSIVLLLVVAISLAETKVENPPKSYLRSYLIDPKNADQNPEYRLDQGMSPAIAKREVSYSSHKSHSSKHPRKYLDDFNSNYLDGQPNSSNSIYRKYAKAVLDGKTGAYHGGNVYIEVEEPDSYEDEKSHSMKKTHGEERKSHSHHRERHRKNDQMDFNREDELRPQQTQQIEIVHPPPRTPALTPQQIFGIVPKYPMTPIRYHHKKHHEEPPRQFGQYPVIVPVIPVGQIMPVSNVQQVPQQAFPSYVQQPAPPPPIQQQQQPSQSQQQTEPQAVILAELPTEERKHSHHHRHKHSLYSHMGMQQVPYYPIQYYT